LPSDPVAAGIALGSAIWGEVAAFAGLPTAHFLAALGAVVANASQASGMTMTGNTPDQAYFNPLPIRMAG
jgi:hypothetical protein